MFIIGPVADLDITVLEVLQGGHRKLAALTDDLGTHVVLHTHRGLALGEFSQLVDEDIFQVVNLSLVFFVDLFQCNLILCLRLAVLDGTLEEFLVNDDTRQRRIGLQ